MGMSILDVKQNIFSPVVLPTVTVMPGAPCTQHIISLQHVAPNRGNDSQKTKVD